jgi:integrase
MLDSYRQKLINKLFEDHLSTSGYQKTIDLGLEIINITRNPKSHLRGNMTRVVVLRLRREISKYVRNKYKWFYIFSDDHKQELYDLSNNKILRKRVELVIDYTIIDEIKKYKTIQPDSLNSITQIMIFLMFSSGRRVSEIVAKITKNGNKLFYTPSKTLDKTPKIFKPIFISEDEWMVIYNRLHPHIKNIAIKTVTQRLNRFLKNTFKITSHVLRKIYATLCSQKIGGNKTQAIKDCLGHQSTSASVFYNQVSIGPRNFNKDGRCTLCGSKYTKVHTKTQTHRTNVECNILK